MKSDKESFEQTALPYLNLVYRAAYTLCNNVDDAEDLTQTTFLRAFERYNTFRKDTNCKAWLLRIMRNRWIDLMRHRDSIGQEVQLDENIIANKEHDEIKYTNCENLLANFSDEQVIKALKSLSDEQRFVLFLIDVEQLSQEEAAEIMNVPIGTIKSRTSRARAILKEKLFSHAKEMGFIGGEK